MADNHDRAPIKSTNPTHDSEIVGKIPVACKWRIFGKQRVDIVAAMWPFGVACDLAFAPSSQVFVQRGLHLDGFFVQSRDLGFDVHFFVIAGECAQFYGFAFDFSKRFFELEILGHGLRLFICSHRYMRGATRVQRALRLARGGWPRRAVVLSILSKIEAD